MPLPSAEQSTSPPSPTSTRSLLSPGNSPVLTNNVEQQDDQQQQQLQEGSSSGATASASSYSSMAAKTVANIKRLQVNTVTMLFQVLSLFVFLCVLLLY
jgi:hypothetical protein